jgi:hypothetical protein
MIVSLYAQIGPTHALFVTRRCETGSLVGLCHVRLPGTRRYGETSLVTGKARYPNRLDPPVNTGAPFQPHMSWVVRGSATSSMVGAILALFDTQHCPEVWL